MKTFNELVKKLSKKDNTPVERLELSKVRSTLEEQCEKYLVDTDDIYQFEALPSAINFSNVSGLTTSYFKNKSNAW